MVPKRIPRGLLDWLKQPRSSRHQTARNFLKSMLLLSIALVAALYSNGAAREGRMLSSGVGALIAMSVALWVGIRFVPALASGVDWQWLPFFTRYRLTREGWIYIAATVVVLSAAINTSNNLLYMIISALLALMIVSGVLSGINYRALKLSVRLPEHCFAKAPFQAAITLENRKRVFPTLSVGIGPVDRSSFGFRPYYVPLVGARKTSTQRLEAVIKSRGLHRLHEVHVESRFPFGFISKRRALRVDASSVAFPEIHPAERLSVSLHDLLGASERFDRGQGMDLYMIRDYVSSDNARHVDWKASAKTSALKTREFAAEDARKVRLLFDRFGQPGDEEAFEGLVSQAASLAFHLSEQGVEVSLSSDDWSSPGGPSKNAVETILYYLALVEMTPDVPLVESGGTGTVVFSLRHGRNKAESIAFAGVAAG